jgi:hypothetical protein
MEPVSDDDVAHFGRSIEAILSNSARSRNACRRLHASIHGFEVDPADLEPEEEPEVQSANLVAALDEVPDEVVEVPDEVEQSFITDDIAHVHGRTYLRRRGRLYRAFTEDEGAEAALDADERSMTVRTSAGGLAPAFTR